MASTRPVCSVTYNVWLPGRGANAVGPVTLAIFVSLTFAVASVAAASAVVVAPVVAGAGVVETADRFGVA